MQARPLIYAMLAVLGLALWSGGNPWGQAAGALALAFGGGGLLIWGRRTLLRWQAERKAERERAERQALQETRRERDAQKRSERERQRLIDAREAANLTAQREREEEAARQAAEAEAQHRAAQDADFERERARLVALDKQALRDETIAIFRRRGFLPELDAADSPDLLILRSEEENALALAQFAFGNRRPDRADIESLETQRVGRGAQHVYLIALAGFTPEAVRAVADLPITLVEAHLLAHWKLTASLEKREKEEEASWRP